MKFILQFVLIIGLALSAQASPFDDGQETNGGDPFAAEFLFHLDSTLNRLPLLLPLENDAAIKREVLEQARRDVEVSSKGSLTLNGREVAAINQPLAIPPKIVVSRSAWKELSDKQKTLLVLHEILPVVGIYDEHYKNSYILFQLAEP